MSDFNNINPDKNLKANFHTNKKAKGGAPDSQAGTPDTTPSTDPYAGLKMSPDKMLDLLAAQGKVNSQNQIENPAIERSVLAFTSKVTPEVHAQVTQKYTQAHINETGRKPHPAVLQKLVDDELIGTVEIKNS